MKTKTILYYFCALFFAVTPIWSTEEAEITPFSEILLQMILIVFSIPLVVYIVGHYLLKKKGTLGYTASGAIVGFVIGSMVDVIAAKDFIPTLNIYIIGLGVFALIGSIVGYVMSHNNRS